MTIAPDDRTTLLSDVPGSRFTPSSRPFALGSRTPLSSPTTERYRSGGTQR